MEFCLSSCKNPTTLALSYFGSVTARHCSSGHQPNFATLNRGRHLYLAGRPSRWALAHIVVLFVPQIPRDLLNGLHQIHRENVFCPSLGQV